MTPDIFSQFINELSTKSAELVVGVSKHTGFFVSFYDVGTTITNLLKTMFK